MIPPDPETKRVIHSVEDIPLPVIVGISATIRAEYLGKLWELSIDKRTKEATLSTVRSDDFNNSTCTFPVMRFSCENVPFDVMGTSDLTTLLFRLVKEKAHKDFVLAEGISHE